MENNKLKALVASALLSWGSHSVALSQQGETLRLAEHEQARNCDGRTAIDVNNCLARRAELPEARLNQYLEVVARRLRTEPGTTRAAFDKSERAFEAYRDAECGAVFQFSKDGTIRTTKEMECNIRLTDARTHTIWENWLRYPDSTPPILPEPRATDY